MFWTPVSARYFLYVLFLTQMVSYLRLWFLLHAKRLSLLNLSLIVIAQIILKIYLLLYGLGYLLRYFVISLSLEILLCDH